MLRQSEIGHPESSAENLGHDQRGHDSHGADGALNYWRL
jgi:hypothetical protein